ncbi:ABC transporter substrate-binding protein [Rhodoplanes sp. Z2-YC6860]|uniref:ABC transporter substrate-binding protein n=1 Tax=Rhodoplanes sp. Z2-YC6860 TaxID=674703 RepID=UPI00078DB94F|nr:ABC transporter substrate-binding protein [Rhodoplanes sp. Z2-YC6860]AMN45452.1 aliphatic sulfonates-binding protein [Rhodoplanes sp. Z2-YC6860]
MGIAKIIGFAAALFAAAPAAAQDQKLAPLKVGVLKMAALTNPWVAKERGIFQKNGIDVTLIEFRTGNEAIAAHRGGSVDIVLSIPGTAMTAVERGFDLVAIAQNEIAQSKGPDTGSVQVLKDSPYQKLADLAGKKIAVSGLHSQKTVAMQTLFKRAGVDVDKLQLIEIPFPSQFDALKSKQVDAVNTVDPYTTQLIASGLGRVIAWDYADSIPEQPLGAWFAKSTYVKANPKAIEGFTKSIKESIEYMMADPQRARAAVVSYTGLPADLVKDMPMIGWDYKVKASKWQAVVDMMVENGELKSKHNADEYFAEQIKPYVTK